MVHNKNSLSKTCYCVHDTAKKGRKHKNLRKEKEAAALHWNGIV
jgi:hypothetical protein